MNTKTIQVLIAAAFYLMGCGSINRVPETYRVNPVFSPEVRDETSSKKEDNNDQNTKTLLEGKNKDYYRKNSDGEILVDTLSEAFQSKLNSANDKTKKEALAFELLSLSDQSCERHKARIISTANTWNITTGSLTNVLAGLGTVVGGETAKAALSAGAALSNSSRSLVNEQLYSNALATTILRAIEIKRHEIKQQIYKGLKNDTEAKEYSSYKMIYDIDFYHQQCSFMVGIIEVSKALENRKPTKADVKENISYLQEQLSAPSDPAHKKKLEEKIISLQLAIDEAAQ